MRELFNRTIALSILLILALCAVLVACLAFPFDVARADESGAEALVSLIDSETETEYASFYDAIAHIKDGMTVKFLKDGEMTKFNVSVGFTIDLNGKNVYINGWIVECRYLTILDSTVDKNGTLSIQERPLQPLLKDGPMTFESGTIKGNGFIFDKQSYINMPTINIYGANIDTDVITVGIVNMTGGYVKKLDYRKYGNYPENVAHISGGKIGTLCHEGANVALSGGTIDKFEFSSGATFEGMLQDDYAFQKADGSELIKLSEMNVNTSVNIVPCPHESFNDKHVCDYCGLVCKHDSYDSDGKCTTCSVEILAKIVDGETETYFASFAEAVAAAPSRNSGKTVTISLLSDCEFCAFSDKSLTIDLNGKILNSSSTNTVTIESSDVTFQDSTTAGEMTINGDIMFFKCTVNVLSGVFTNVSGNDYTDFSIYMETAANITGGVFDITLMATLYSNTTINGSAGSYDLRISNLCVITANSVKISNAYIRKFSVYKIMPMLKDNVFIGEMKFYDTETDYKGVLCKGYAYCAADGTGYVKPSDMNATTPVYAQKCSHESFTVNEQDQYVCDYCGYVCVHETFDTTTHACALCSYPCPHESYDEKGVCKACSYVCPHENVDDSNVCDICKNVTNVKVSNGQGIKYFIDLESAFAVCEDEDELVILNDMELKSTKTVNKNVTLDLNGKKLLVCSVNFNSKSIVKDSVGGGLIIVSADFTNDSADIELIGKDNTEFRIFKYSIKIKVYGGKITKVSCNHGELCDLLPIGYMFVENGKALLWSDVLKKSADYDGALTVQKCQHTALNEDLVCKYCNYSMPTGEAIDRVYNDLESAKDELQAAIDQKADAATINEKITQLNEAIQKAEIAKAYADEKDTALKSDLESTIATAKSDAINSSKDALDKATKELTTKIAEKASASEVNEAIDTLNAAIANAQSVNNAYVDEKTVALKAELENKIAEAQDEVTAAISALSARLEAVENKTNTLQTVLIVFIVLLSLANIATVVTFILRKRN